jgi:hypothetical protein
MNRVVIVICDSLRADLITARDAPFLTELGQRSARFAAHRSVFPSTTRTSAASIATGCLPVRHGLLGNTMALDEGDGLVCLSVGKPDFRDRMHRATGRTLHMPTLAERVSRAGETAMASAGSTTLPAATVPVAARSPSRRGLPSPKAPSATVLRPSGFARRYSATAHRRSRCCGCRSPTTPVITRRSAPRHIARRSRAQMPMCAGSPRPSRGSTRPASASSSSPAPIMAWRPSTRRSISIGF